MSRGTHDDRGGSGLAVDDAAVALAPFLRWAGSKRWLVPTLAGLIPPKFNNYYEPFLGSATVFFNFAYGHQSYLSDIIKPLIDTYVAVRDHPSDVAALAESWGTDSESYYSVRGRVAPSGSVEAAARFLYLNKLCFNGLYRENGSGRFNVPYGRPRATNRVVNLGDLKECSTRLRDRVHLQSCDFEKALLRCEERDLVYLDPPYVAGHRSNGFVDYNAKIFNWEDQERLADVFHSLDEKGVYVIQTNADHPTLRELYKGYSCLSVSRHSSMSGKSGGRGISQELVILSSRAARERRS